jgi:hypothetical protein
MVGVASLEAGVAEAELRGVLGVTGWRMGCSACAVAKAGGGVTSPASEQPANDRLASR